MSIFSSYKKIFLLGFIAITLLAIPLIVYVAQQRQQTTSKAAKSTTLFFEPNSSTVNVGKDLILDVWLDPASGTDTSNQVSFVKLSINFDPSIFEAASKCLTENKQSPNTLTEPLEESLCESGNASISLSIGADPTKILTTKTKIATFQLKATAKTTPTAPNITFGSDTQVLSIASTDQTSENVLSTTTPATITITEESGTADTKIPICSSLNVDRSTTGNAPYSLTFTAVGNDSDGIINKASFNFGDGPVQEVTTGGGIGTNSVNAQMSHTYNNAGTYTAYAILTDNNNNLSNQQAGCTKTITVNSTQIAGAVGSDTGTAGAVLIPIVITQIPQPLPTEVILPPVGPGEEILVIGIIGTILTIIGGALFILL